MNTLTTLSMRKTLNAVFSPRLSKFVARGIKDSHCRQDADFEAVFSGTFEDLYMMYLPTKFHMPNSSGLLVVDVKPKAR
jgi:hypothetical protein